MISVFLFFNNFKNVITQIPTKQQIIPAVIEKENKQDNMNFHEFKPEEEILEELLPKNISTQISKHCSKTQQANKDQNDSNG